MFQPSRHRCLKTEPFAMVSNAGRKTDLQECLFEKLHTVESYVVLRLDNAAKSKLHCVQCERGFPSAWF